MDEDIQLRIREIISEIEEKSANGNYLYRGEPKHYKKVSSTLYRQYEDDVNPEHLDIKSVQDEMLKEVKRYVRGMDDQEILTQLQHYGGKTNRIDFTNDYLIALFFACDGVPAKNGRVILLKENEKTEDYIEEPQSPINRVRDQKSVFYCPPKGFIERDLYEIIDVPKCLKYDMLDQLGKYHGIHTNTIYNDLHGFLRVEHLHHDATKEFYKGVICHQGRWYDDAIEHYTEAIKLNPRYVNAHSNRGHAYNYNQPPRYDLAIVDCTRAIELDSSYAYAYHNRGFAYMQKGNYALAKNDLTKVVELNPTDAEAYNDRGYLYRVIGEYSLAIDDLTKAVELNPNHSLAYSNRGIARLHLTEFREAESDLRGAERGGINVINMFNQTYRNITKAFQNSTGITLPADIAEILTST